ncbi:hypothetical protein D5086_017207 [Populus alba]|uniref:Uncharacterized protein n=1 Tax=Populus alba TaxID=43335 RepID=A0ACC4BW64_POPAL
MQGASTWGAINSIHANSKQTLKIGGSKGALALSSTEMDKLHPKKLGLHEIAKAAIMAKVFKDGPRAENASVHHLEVYSDSPTLG